MLTIEQSYVKKMMLLGLLTSVLVIASSWFLAAEFRLESANQLPARLKVYLLTLFISVIPLAILISRIASKRFFGSAISGDSSDPVVEIDIKVLNNTHEQFQLFAVASLILSAGLSEGRIAMPMVLAVAFCFYRFLFWFGYHKNPCMRAFGFATTFYSNLILLVFSVWLII